MEKEEKFYVYMTINIINYKKYIGITHKPIKSGYVGSGVLITKAIKKYGKHFFIRHDLYEGTREECSEVEYLTIKMYDATNNKGFYNLKEGGYDGKHGESTINLLSDKITEKWKDENYRNKTIDSFSKRDKTHISNLGKRDKSGVKNPMYGKNHSLKTREKLSKLKTGSKQNLTEESRNKLRQDIRKNKVLMGKKSNLQRARNRWAAISKLFGKDPIIHHDLRMMHEFYGFTDDLNKLDKHALLEYLKFRFRFLQEELNEGNKAIEDKNAEEVVDSLIDIIVVAMGTLDLYDIDFKKSWYRVLQANMNKERGIKEGRPNPFGLPDLCKPAGWQAPSHQDNHGKIGKIFEGDKE